MQRCIATVLLLCVALSLSGSTAADSVGLEQRSASGREGEYVLHNQFLRATIQPGRGGRAVLGGGEGSAGMGTDAVLADSFGARQCRYRVGYATGSSTLAIVSLQCSRGAVQIRKTYSLLEGESALRVRYRIENRLGQSMRLETESLFRTLGGDSALVGGLGQVGLDRWKAQELRGGRRAAWTNPRWASLLSQEEGGGYVFRPGPGVWEEARVTEAGDGGSLRATSTSVQVPPDGRLEADLQVIRVRELSSVMGVSQGFVTDMSAETAGNTARLDIRLYPFRRVGINGVRLAVGGGAGETLTRLRRDGLGLGPGRVTELSFYWRAPRPSWYNLRLGPLQDGDTTWLGSRLQVPGGTLDVEVPDLSAPSIVRARGRREGGDDLPLPAESSANFHYRGGEPLFSLDLHLAREEQETAVFEVEFPDVEGRLSFDMDSALEAEDGSVIPASDYDMVQIENEGQGEGDGSWSRLALRVSAANCEPGTYRGRVVFRCRRERALLPVKVRVWPVVRPRPGPVRLHAYPVRLSVGETASSTQAWQAAWRRANVAVTCPGKGVWAAQWMDLLGVHPLAYPAIAEIGTGEGDLPLLDFSGLAGQLEALVLLGIGEFAAVVDVGRPPLSSGRLRWDSQTAGQSERRVSWFWTQFASFIQGKGMSGLYVASPWPLSAHDITERWMRRAFTVADTGWSVCGPYRESAISKLTVSRLDDVTSLALITRDSLAADPALADRLAGSPGPGLETGMYVPPSSDGDLESILDGLRSAWQPSVGVVAVGPLSPGGGEGANVRLKPGTVAWEEMLDVLDLLNYVALLDKIRGGSDGGDSAPELPSPTRGNKEAILRKLSEAWDGEDYPAGALRWRDLELARAGSDRVHIVADADTGQTLAPSQALAYILSSSSRADFQPVEAADIAGESDGQPLIVLATPPFGSFFSNLLPPEEQSESVLAAKIRTGGSTVLHFTSGGRDVVALLGVDAAELGQSVLSFTSGIERQWVPVSGTGR